MASADFVMFRVFAKKRNFKNASQQQRLDHDKHSLKGDRWLNGYYTEVVVVAVFRKRAAPFQPLTSVCFAAIQLASRAVPEGGPVGLLLACGSPVPQRSVVPILAACW